MDIENTQVLDQVVNTTPDVSLDPDVEKAQAGGWKPLEEWEGNPEEWIDAKTFNKNGEYIDHIKSLSSEHKKAQKKIAKLEKEFSLLSEHHAKVSKVEYDNAMRDLKALRREAFSNMDMDQVDEIETKIDELRETQIQAPKAQPQTVNSDVEVEVWKKTNSWYSEDKTMRALANGLIQEVLQEDPDRIHDPVGVLEEITQQLKVEFPNKFGTRTRATSATIEPDNSGKKQTTSLSRRLNDEQRRFAKRFVDMGAVDSIESYAKQLHDIGELK